MGISMRICCCWFIFCLITFDALERGVRELQGDSYKCYRDGNAVKPADAIRLTSVTPHADE